MLKRIAIAAFLSIPVFAQTRAPGARPEQLARVAGTMQLDEIRPAKCKSQVPEDFGCAILFDVDFLADDMIASMVGGVVHQDNISINDRGEIPANGVLPNGDFHAILLLPCDDDLPDVAGCDYGMVDVSISAAQTTPVVRDSSTGLSRRMNRYRLPGLGAPRPN